MSTSTTQQSTQPQTQPQSTGGMSKSAKIGLYVGAAISLLIGIIMCALAIYLIGNEHETSGKVLFVCSIASIPIFIILLSIGLMN